MADTIDFAKPVIIPQLTAKTTGQSWNDYLSYLNTISTWINTNLPQYQQARNNGGKDYSDAINASHVDWNNIETVINPRNALLDQDLGALNAAQTSVNAAIASTTPLAQAEIKAAADAAAAQSAQAQAEAHATSQLTGTDVVNIQNAKIAADTAADTTASQTSNTKMYIIFGIIITVLIVGTIIVIKMRKK